ncbi:MAG TPA: hypothetical protein VK718_11795 [Ferruginibacter sp.]|jgi:hypothetical protein|nr:hypothetical protein [Ferruginibacter sp.]
MERDITKTLFALALFLGILVMADNFLFPKIRATEVLSNTAFGGSYAGSDDPVGYFMTTSNKEYCVPSEVFDGVNVGDTFIVWQTPVFKQGIRIQHKYNGNTYVDNIRWMNFPSTAFSWISFMILLSIFNFYYPQFNNDPNTQLRLSLVFLAFTLAGIFVYMYG